MKRGHPGFWPQACREPGAQDEEMQVYRESAGVKGTGVDSYLWLMQD